MNKKCVICEKKLTLKKPSNFYVDRMSEYSYSSRKIPEYMHWDLYECRSCRVLYSNCPIESEDIFAGYEDAAFDSANEADYASDTYMEYLKRVMPDFPKGKILDIGTGDGSFLVKLKKAGVKELVGIEPSKEPIKCAKISIKDCIINEPYKVKKYEDDDYDLISLFQTVEHIPEPFEIVRDIRRILKPGGVFYLVCHDYMSLVNKLLGYKSPIYDIEHLQIFSKRGIVKLLNKVGFKDVRVFTLKNRYPLSYWVRLFPMNDAMKKRLSNRIRDSRIGDMMIEIDVGNVGVIAIK